jgi:hypothetical protein
MGVAGEHKHLPISCLIGHEGHQRAGRRSGASVVKVDEGIIHHDRQHDAVLVQASNQGQPQGQKDLFTSASAEPLRVPDRAGRIVDIESCLVDGCGDPDVTALGQLFEPV